MNRLKCTIKQEPDALDLSNRPQHLLSPSLENEHDDDDDDYLPSEDEQNMNNNQETKHYITTKVIFYLKIFR